MAHGFEAIALLVAVGGVLLSLVIAFRLASIGHRIDHRLATLVDELRSRQREQRDELLAVETRLHQESTSNIAEVRQAREELRSSLEGKLEHVRTIVDTRLRELHEFNQTKLEQMRVTVDEKLQSTLEQRLGESFRQVSEHLASVQRGLGEVQTLAQSVGSLNRVLSNVKTRGIFGETQLESILSDMLHPEMYRREFSPRGDGERVDFAVRMPGRGGTDSCQTFIPIDAKFPREDYERMLAASEAGDQAKFDSARRALLKRIEESAAEVSKKYISPPITTNFALLFLATEGLYAEVLREPGLHERLQRDYKVIVTGPTTVSAILTSLAVGFQTQAIEERSDEIRRVLSGVRNEFGKFAVVLGRVQKQLGTASRSIDETFKSTRRMERALQEVEAPHLPRHDTHVVELQEDGEDCVTDNSREEMGHSVGIRDLDLTRSG